MHRMKSGSYPFTQLSVFLQVPAKPGVYALHNFTRCIYIGDTDNLRKALKRHIRGDNPWVSLWEPSGVYFELWPETGRYERKVHLITEFQPLLTDTASECLRLSTVANLNSSADSIHAPNQFYSTRTRASNQNSVVFYTNSKDLTESKPSISVRCRKMIYLITYNENRFDNRNTKRLILVESDRRLETERAANLVRMLTDGNFKETSVEIAGQKDCEATQIRHPALRIYKLD